jgi:tetratricopeptide (TPR) repeat protein
MEILKGITCAIISILVLTNNIKAQSNDDIKAFRASYAKEYKGDYTGAIAELQKAYKANSYEANLRMGWLKYNARKFAESMEYYQKAMDLKPYSIEAKMGFIKPANEAKKYDRAYQVYEEILKIDPYNSTANYWVGVNYYTVKKYDIAAKYFQLLVNLYPFDYDGNYMLAWTFLNLGRSQEAKVLFAKALLNRPDDKAAADGLSRCK